MVIYRDAWSVHWDTGERTGVDRLEFTGTGGVLITVPTLHSHAIRNDGAADLMLINFADVGYDPAAADTYSRPVVSA